jgi:nitrogen regulatory protein P-II 1
MKEIKATIQPHVLNRVLWALRELPHFTGVTVLDTTGHGRSRGKDHAYEASPDETLMTHKHKRIEIICSDALAPSIAETIRKAAHTGHPGDGIITIADLDQVVRIRTGEEQEQAV